MDHKEKERRLRAAQKVLGDVLKDPRFEQPVGETEMIFHTIEHPSRGVFVEYDYNNEKPVFQWSEERHKGEWFWTAERAVRTLKMFKPSLAARCKIVTWKSNPKPSIIHKE